MAGRVQAAFGCDLGAPFGNHADDVGLDLQGQGDDFRHVGHLEVETGFDDLAELADIAVLDVAAVFAQVRGDAVRAGRFTNQRRLNGVRFAALASSVPVAASAASTSSSDGPRAGSTTCSRM